MLSRPHIARARLPVEQTSEVSQEGLDGAALQENELRNPMRVTAFRFALALIFVRFSMIQQIFKYLTGIDSYLLYIVGIPAIFAILATGGLRRCFRFRPAIYWSCYALWMIPTSIFSTWKSGSLELMYGFWRTELIMLLVVGGCVMNWRECRLVILTVASAAVVNLASIPLFGKSDPHSRESLGFGTVANSNDLAGHLLLVLPFLMWIVLGTKSFFLRLVVFLLLGYGLYQVLATGSRGALLGVIAALLVFVFSATPKVRLITILVVPVLLILVASILPKADLNRILSFSHDDSSASKEALASSAQREQLLEDSITFTLQHPLLGIGPGQFPVNEGKFRKLPGEGPGLYYGTHNTYTEASSEMGILALVFLLCGIGSTLALLNKIGRHCKGKSELANLSRAVFCVRIAVVGFSVAIFFLNFAYTFYLPSMGGMAIALAWATIPGKAVPAEEPKKIGRIVGLRRAQSSI